VKVFEKCYRNIFCTPYVETKRKVMFATMRKYFIFMLLCAVSVLPDPEVLAGETGHYMCGTEGIKLGTIAPPGFYYKIYNVFYNTHAIKDNHGNQAHLRPDIQDYVMVHRPILITDKKILGGNYFATVLLPFAYADFRVKETGTSDSGWSYGDICFEFFGLAWHGQRWDSLCSLSIYVPTGEYSRRRPASLGKDFWTLMLSPGGTIYFDTNKTLALSALMRYEVHSKKKRDQVRPGQDLSIDWALSKKIANLWDVGIIGYAHWQITDDTGSGVTWDKHIHDRVFAAGPEVSVYVPFLRVQCQLRHQIEFGAQDRSQGSITTMSFTLIF